MKYTRSSLACGLLMGAGILLAACTPNPDAHTANPDIPPSGSSEGFQIGYLAGCNAGRGDANPSGYGDTSPHMEEHRYATDAQYKQGWDEGHALCYEDERKAPYMGRVGGGGGSNL